MRAATPAANLKVVLLGEGKRAISNRVVSAFLVLRPCSSSSESILQFHENDCKLCSQGSRRAALQMCRNASEIGQDVDAPACISVIGCLNPSYLLHRQP